MGHMWLYLYDTMLDIDTRTLDSRVIQALTVAVEGGLAIVSTLQRDLTFGILFIILLFLISFEGDLSAKFGFQQEIAGGGGLSNCVHEPTENHFLESSLPG